MKCELFFVFCVPVWRRELIAHGSQRETRSEPCLHDGRRHPGPFCSVGASSISMSSNLKFGPLLVKKRKSNNGTLPIFYIFFSSSPKVPIQTRTVDEFGLLRAGSVCVSGGVRGPNFARYDKGHAYALSRQRVEKHRPHVKVKDSANPNRSVHSNVIIQINSMTNIYKLRTKLTNMRGKKNALSWGRVIKILLEDVPSPPSTKYNPVDLIFAVCFLVICTRSRGNHQRHNTVI